MCVTPKYGVSCLEYYVNLNSSLLAEHPPCNTMKPKDFGKKTGSCIISFPGVEIVMIYFTLHPVSYELMRCRIDVGQLFSYRYESKGDPTYRPAQGLRFLAAGTRLAAQID